ncbi:hypothetical protein AURANDRAFT_68500 [Aureococcus anophagefferens]|uniref:Uncharacterized protein n=1 Tax=Aureococcus anophagefferens TaxID=44056 RepID=F0YPV0_AURAN|nr:hypothetical protein AURANDRAFT_68500 [Aureococcus anophagefferens]EGB02859.1 hypothetical protein AURANDRAFT_68500 [Aureococcus anophagefferens]|eukprot:XP_009042438.1 hypothetical protein AURANDRAFT_68500 [Aureococcus anophagefferens]
MEASTMMLRTRIQASCIACLPCRNRENQGTILSGEPVAPLECDYQHWCGTPRYVQLLGYRADTEAQKAKEKLRKTQETREKIAAKKRKTPPSKIELASKSQLRPGEDTLYGSACSRELRHRRPAALKAATPTKVPSQHTTMKNVLWDMFETKVTSGCELHFFPERTLPHLHFHHRDAPQNMRVLKTAGARASP